MEIPEDEGWILNVGVEPAYRGEVDLLFRNGKYHQGSGLEFWKYPWRWELIGADWDIIKWRPKNAE